MKKNFLCLILVTCFFSGFTQSNSTLSCSQNPVYRQFDFWIGDWDVYNLKGALAGTSHVERLLDSCVILENWTSTQAGYAGKSYNTYNTATGRWQQYWVDNRGGVTEYFDGHFENNTMILQTSNNKQPGGGYLIQKMTFFHLNDDTVRQFGENSTDGGQTWKTAFDLTYKRKK
ncbi:MAG: hypothetical protein KGO92_01350 [Bacteroidota bacterium]|nr:hypothetical protein [Bacteroidota bacterium]